MSFFTNNSGPSDVVTVVGNVRKEIAVILRNVVDTIAKYSSLYLPTDAKQTIKQFILDLPSKISVFG